MKVWTLKIVMGHTLLKNYGALSVGSSVGSSVDSDGMVGQLW